MPSGAVRGIPSILGLKVTVCSVNMFMCPTTSKATTTDWLRNLTWNSSSSFRKRKDVSNFSVIYRERPGLGTWPFDKNVDLFERRILDKQRYFRELIRDLRDDNDDRKKLDVPFDIRKMPQSNEFPASTKKTMETEQKMADFIATTRIYQKCFVEGWVPHHRRNRIIRQNDKQGSSFSNQHASWVYFLTTPPSPMGFLWQIILVLSWV